MKNAGFWAIETQFEPHRKQYLSATILTHLMLLRLQVFTLVIMKSHVLGYGNPSSYLTGNS
jgi:hypothetical protein